MTYLSSLERILKVVLSLVVLNAIVFLFINYIYGIDRVNVDNFIQTNIVLYVVTIIYIFIGFKEMKEE